MVAPTPLRDICMFSFGKNLAQALMKYSPIDPPVACAKPSIWSLFHSLVVVESFASALNSHTQLEETQGTGAALLSLLVCISLQAKFKLALHKLPGELLKTGFTAQCSDTFKSSLPFLCLG